MLREHPFERLPRSRTASVLSRRTKTTRGSSTPSHDSSIAEFENNQPAYLLTHSLPSVSAGMQWISELERERGGEEEENREYQTPNEGNKEISVDASVWAYVCVCVCA